MAKLCDRLLSVAAPESRLNRSFSCSTSDRAYKGAEKGRHLSQLFLAGHLFRQPENQEIYGGLYCPLPVLLSDEAQAVECQIRFDQFNVT